MTTCHKCEGPMRLGQAFLDVPTMGAPDFLGDGTDSVGTMSYGQEAALVDVMKCADCGRSFTLSKSQRRRMQTRIQAIEEAGRGI